MYVHKVHSDGSIELEVWNGTESNVVVLINEEIWNLFKISESAKQMGDTLKIEDKESLFYGSNTESSN